MWSLLTMLNEVHNVSGWHQVAQQYLCIVNVAFIALVRNLVDVCCMYVCVHFCGWILSRVVSGIAEVLIR